MQQLKLHIIPTDLLKQYKSEFEATTWVNFDNLLDSDLSIETFSFYTSVSVVFSSKIEGEDIELDSFIKHKRYGIKYQPDYTRKIDDLHDAYRVAQQSHIVPKTVQKVHALLTRHILQKSGLGGFRTGNMFVLTKDGRIEYVAAAPEKVRTDMKL